MAEEQEPARLGNVVFTVSMVFCLIIGAWGLVDPDSMTGTMLGFTNYLLASASWFWLFLCTCFLILSAYLAFGPYGKIRLGRDDEEPEFSTFSWIAMLFAGGMGSGLLFWGVAEPVHHFTAPPGMTGGTAAAAREAMVITNLHWGLHAWSIYGVCALVIAYFTFRRGEDSMISTPILHVFKGPSGKIIGNIADILGVLAVVFGLAGSLAMGTLSVRSGLGFAYGTPETITVSIIILIALYICYMLSATTGVDKGIKILSNLNMLIAIALMLLVIFAGPTSFILESFIDTVGAYFTRIIYLSFRLFPYAGLDSWLTGWTLTYLVWWIAWGPFIGIFVARISRGRTIREFCFGVIIVPTLFSMLWFAAFGGAGIYIELFGGGGLSDVVFSNVSQALFVFFDYFPGTPILNTLALALVFIFLVTSADSGTFVLSMMTSGGSLNPPLVHKMVWGTLIAGITVGTIFTQSVAVAKAMAIAGALPFAVILVIQIIGFLREIRKELPGRAHPIEARGTTVGRARPPRAPAQTAPATPVAGE